MLIAMRETARLAGFFAAHGIWSVADGGTLTPLLGYEQTDGGRGMDRFAAGDTAEAVHAGQDALQANRRGSVRAVLVTDAYIQLGTGRSDALIVQAVEYGPGRQSMTMAIPYRRNHPRTALPYTGPSSSKSPASMSRTTAPSPMPSSPASTPTSRQRPCGTPTSIRPAEQDHAGEPLRQACPRL